MKVELYRYNVLCVGMAFQVSAANWIITQWIDHIGAVVENGAGLFIVVRIERSVGDRGWLCCGRSGVPGSRSSTGRSHCVKPFTE